MIGYHGKVEMGTGLAKLGGGVAMLGAIVGCVIFMRKPKQPTALRLGPARYRQIASKCYDQ
jgi:hypothetical protein